MWAAEMTLNTDTTLSTEGYFVLNWSSDLPDSFPLVLEQARSVTFPGSRTINVPANGAITITGLADGEYYYRLGTDGEYSNVVAVTVAHHSLGRALGFFLTGLSLFLVLLFTIVHGSRRRRGGDNAG